MNTQVIPLVEEAVRERLQAGAAFTALDVSNILKAANFPVCHGDVAVVVRDVYGSGAMNAYNYRLTLIGVTTEAGRKRTQAFLYLPQPMRERDYQARTQDALPPVPADQARDLSDCIAAGTASAVPRSPRSMPRSPRGRTRRDGALSVPLTLVRQMGWTSGATLSIRAEQGKLIVRIGAGDILLRVWSGDRVRVCRRTLRLGGLRLDSVTWETQGDVLRITGS